MSIFRSRQWLWLLLAAPVALGFARLRFDVEVLNLLPGELPVVEGLKLYQQSFSNARELIVTVRAPEAEQAEVAARSLAQTLRTATNLVSTVTWQPGWLEHPEQAAELIGYLWLNQEPRVFAELTNRLSGPQLTQTLAEAREQLASSMSPLELGRRSYDPLNLMKLPEDLTAGLSGFGQGDEMFVAGEGTFRIIFVEAKPDLTTYRACRTWLEAIQSSVEASRARGEIPAGVTLGYTGRPAFVTEISGGMEHDMTWSVGLTSIIIAVLFWLAHRRWGPMLWLLALLSLILAGTLGLGGLLFGSINVVSLGFAAILLGLAVDYGVVHYQEAIASPQAIVPEIRRAIGPSIFWAAFTTISAFLVLNFGGLPGLAQLGSLVALGVSLSALVMLFAFLPPLFRDRLKRRQEQIASRNWPPPQSERNPAVPARSAVSACPPDARPSPGRSRAALVLTAGLILASATVLLFGLPPLDHTANALRPQNSPAYAALEEIKTRLAHDREPLWMLARSPDEATMERRLEKAEGILARAAAAGALDSFMLPTRLWPNPPFQSVNRAAVAPLLAQRTQIASAASAQGFTTNSLIMAQNIFHTWQTALAQPGVFWPTNDTSRWILSKMVAHPHQEFLAVGFVFPATNSIITPASISSWGDAVSREGFLVSGWELLGSAILQRVRQNLWFVLTPMVLLVLFSLWLAFRRLTEVLLSCSVLLLSGLCLLALMRSSTPLCSGLNSLLSGLGVHSGCKFVGGSWNLLNLMALPLMLGSGVDYSIFMQLALRRHHGDLAAAHRSVGRALLLCGGTAVAGFGSLSLSSNAGMASLGQVCAIGIGCNMLISVYLLPFWWRAATAKKGAMAKASRLS